MRALSHWIIALCASPAGVVVLAALDSTLFFSLPFGIDAAVIILAARLGRSGGSCRCSPPPDRSPAPRSPSGWASRSASRGSTAGCPPSGWRGSAPACARSGAIALAVLDLIPPPFPFTPFVLAAGALEVEAAHLLRHADRLPHPALRPRGRARRHLRRAASWPGSTRISSTRS